MKQHFPKSYIRPSLLTHLSAISLLALVGSVQANEIFISNPSFESPQVGVNNLSLNPDEDGFGWVPWQGVTGSYFGALGVNPEVNVFYNAVPPGEAGVTGDQVGFLYNPNNSAGDGAYGMEQELEAYVSEGARIYRLSVDVGNPRTNGDGDDVINLNGFPNYRIQLRAGNSLIYENLATLDLEDGEFGNITMSMPIYANSALAGQQLSIRLINENNNDDYDDYDGGDPEVNFDNIQLEIGPIGSFNPITVQPYNNEIRYHADQPDPDNDSTNWGFTLSGKGKKRLLITGAGTSLHTRIKALASDPFLTLTSRGRAITRNDDWTRSKEYKTIAEILAKQDVKLDPSESAILVELGAGDYTATLSTQAELGVYSGMKIYDLDPKGKLKLRFDNAEQRLIDMWGGRSERK